jgi:hypothetical protein
MARIVRLTEQDLARIVRRVINENVVGFATMQVKRGSVTIVTNGVSETLKNPPSMKPKEIKIDTKIMNASSDVIILFRTGPNDGNHVVMVNRANCPSTGAAVKYLAKKYDGQNLAAKVKPNLYHSDIPGSNGAHR